jgi:hypothetical protein
MRTCTAWYGTKDTHLPSPVQAVSPTPGVSRAGRTLHMPPMYTPGVGCKRLFD